MALPFVLLIFLGSVEAHLDVKASDLSGNDIPCVNKFSSFKVTCKTPILKSAFVWNITNIVRVRCSDHDGVCIPANYSTYSFTSNTVTNESVVKAGNYSDANGTVFICTHSDETAFFTAVLCVPIVSVLLKKDGKPLHAAELKVLVGTPTDLTCETSPVSSVPKPTIEWYVGTSLKQSSTSKTFSFTAEDEENDLQIYCKAYNTQPADGIESHKPNLYVQVKVPYVTLRQGYEILTDGKSLIVNAGTPIDLTCRSGHSRPEATIDWYINYTLVQQNAPTYTLNATDEDHDRHIYCKAHNIPGEGFVESGKPTLYVFVKVSSVTLKHGTRKLNTGENLTVTQGVSTTLECEPGPSRPPPVINWFIGGQLQSGTGTSVAFNFSNSQHEKTIYCTANNSQTATENVKSDTPELYVRVEAGLPDLLAETTNLLDGDTYHLQCRSTATRPAAVVILQIRTSNLTLTNLEEVTNKEGLVSVTRTVSYKASKNHHKSYIVCKSKTPSQKVFQRAENLITIMWPPTTPAVIPTKDFPWLEDQTGVLRCNSSDFGNPPSVVTWSKGVGTKTSVGELSIGPLTYKHDEQPVACQLQNNYTLLKGGPIVSTDRQLEVEYSPIPTIMVADEEVYTTEVVEGKNITAKCTAIGNPMPRTSWPGAIPHLSERTFIDINRSQADNYTCRAEAKSEHYPFHDFITEVELIVTVYFPPDVHINISGQLTENSSAEITCLPNGLPNVYRFGTWKQIWSDTEITSNPLLSTESTIVIPSLHLQDSGNYTCSVNNNITDREGKLNQTATTEIRVKGFPKIFKLPSVFPVGSLEKNITMSFPFYSYPEYRNVTVLSSNDTELDKSHKYLMFIDASEVTTTFYERSVTLMGHVLNFTITDLDQRDFANYSLRVINEMGSTDFLFSVVSESIPWTPTDFRLLTIKYSTALFSWIEGFNGGSAQTFLLQLSDEGLNNWSNESTVDEHDGFINQGKRPYTGNITNLKPGSYNVRLVAINAIGMTEPVSLKSPIRITKSDEEPKPFPVAAAVGGGVGAAVLVIAAVLAVIAWKRRSKTNTDDSKKSFLSPKRRPKMAECADNAEVNINPMYESADTVQLPANTDVYAEVNKQAKQRNLGASSDVNTQVQTKEAATSRKPPAFSPEIYSTPVKKGKRLGKKDKQEKKKSPPGKPNEGLLYENANSLNAVKDPDNVYENPACNTSGAWPTRKTNEDGLIYIDVELPQQKNMKNQKPVIHGEDRTIYADVAFGQVGEQMPDSDEDAPKEAA